MHKEIKNQNHLKMEESIPLSQQIYLLGVHPEKGGIRSAAHAASDYIILGSLFMELYALKKIRFENKRIVVLSTKADTDLHRFMLQKMNSSAKPRKISTWINKFYYSLKYIRTEVQDALVDKRLLRMEKKHFLFFRWKKPRITNKQVFYRLNAEIEGFIFKGTSREEDLILLSFIEPGGLLFSLFSERKKRKEAKKRLKEMMVKNRVSSAVADAIAASQAVAASVAVTVAATSAATS